MIPENEIKKILVFKLCCQGDVIHLTPVTDALKFNFPHSKIDFITSSWTAPIIKQFKNIDNVKVVEYNLNKSFFFQLKLLFILYRTIKKGNYNLVFLAHRNNIYGYLLRLTGIKYRIGFSGTAFINFPAEFDEKQNETLRYLNILRSLGLAVKNIIPHLELPENFNELNIKYNKQNKTVLGIFPFGGVNPGTDMRIKRWELEKYISLCKKVQEHHKEISIIIFEGKLEDEKIKDASDIQGAVITDDFSAISICSFFVTNDTGALHIAAAYGIPTLSVFGPSNPEILAPLNEPGSHKHRYIWKKPPCSPCWNPQTSYNRKNKKYWKGNRFLCYTGTLECINKITVEEVYELLNTMLKM